jgi:hypothetical protein
MRRLEAYFAGFEKEFGETVPGYEFGWMAVQFGVAFSEMVTIAERNGWKDAAQVQFDLIRISA